MFSGFPILISLSLSPLLAGLLRFLWGLLSLSLSLSILLRFLRVPIYHHSLSLFKKKRNLRKNPISHSPSFSLCPPIDHSFGLFYRNKKQSLSFWPNSFSMGTPITLSVRMGNPTSTILNWLQLASIIQAKYFPNASIKEALHH